MATLSFRLSGAFEPWCTDVAFDASNSPHLSVLQVVGSPQELGQKAEPQPALSKLQPKMRRKNIVTPIQLTEIEYTQLNPTIQCKIRQDSPLKLKPC